MEAVIQQLEMVKAQYGKTLENAKQEDITVMFDNGLTVRRDIVGGYRIVTMTNPVIYTPAEANRLVCGLRNGNGESPSLVSVIEFCKRNIEKVEGSLELLYSHKATKYMTAPVLN